MSRFANVETETLVELLAENTRQLTRLFLHAKNNREYEERRNAVQEIQAELERRQNPHRNNTQLDRRLNSQLS